MSWGFTEKRELCGEPRNGHLCATRQWNKDFSRVMGVGRLSCICHALVGCLGLTPNGLGMRSPKVAQTAGLLGMIILGVPGRDGEGDIPLVRAPKGLYQHKDWLIKELYRMSKLQGGFKFDADGKSFTSSGINGGRREFWGR